MGEALPQPWSGMGPPKATHRRDLYSPKRRDAGTETSANRKIYSVLPEEHPRVQHHLPDRSSRCPRQDVDPQTKLLSRQAAPPVAGGYLPPTYVPAPHVLRLGAHSGAVAAPTDLLLDQVLYAVVHLQVLQETEPWLATAAGDRRAAGTWISCRGTLR